METDIKANVICDVTSIAISLSGIYFFMIEPVNSKAKAEIKARLESPTNGPFDQSADRCVTGQLVVSNRRFARNS